jgi:hypothetical protein
MHILKKQAHTTQRMIMKAYLPLKKVKKIIFHDLAIKNAGMSEN